MSKRLTTEEFIKKAKKVHGDRYDYSKVNYINCRTKVSIICPIHGEFLQSPGQHLRGDGCPKCFGNEKKTTEQFIKEAKAKFGDKYDYSRVDYKGSEIPVIIGCKKHGWFKQTPHTHLKSSVGCPKCAEEVWREKKVLTNEDFVRKAKEIHGNRYDYSKTNYVNYNTKVCIICPIHGEFWQNPGTHLRGSGCPKCFGMEKKTTEQFIKEGKVIHGDRYDYSKTVYVTKRTKLCVTCRKHGDFWVLPGNHLRDEKHGNCPKCGIEEKRCTTEDFIKKAKEIHGDKYDYSKVEYKTSNDKVCIICPGHGEFWQTASSHLSGRGCKKCRDKKCGQSAKLTQEEFIRRAIKTHGNRYNYSKVKYTKSATKVCIICPEHGEFWQTPSGHIAGQGCPVCGGHMLKTTEQFIEDTKKVHGDKYDYSKVVYENSKKPVCIICPKHGEFWQTPNAHLRGNGCRECAFEKNPIGLPSNTEDFIRKAKEVHGNKYDYSETVYEYSLKDLKIICPEHGEFWQKPSNHLCGTGCPKCNESRLERMVRVELEKNGLQYIYNKTHKWLGRQTLDFYIPSLNVGIECQGEQHYFPCDYFGGDERFENIKVMDERKKRLCKENNIPLYYFTWEEYKEYQPEAYADVKLLIEEIINNNK